MGEDDEKHRVIVSGGLAESETDENGLVYPVHCRSREFADPFFQPAFIDGPDLFQENNAVLCQSVSGRKLNMSGELCFVDLAGDRGRDDGGGVFVSHVVLYNEYGTDSALFAADHRR